MIINLTFSNFYSFTEGTELSFELGKKPSASAYDIDVSPNQRLNKVVAVVGANGSGKTQLIKPLAFLGWFIGESFLGSDPKTDIPYKTHALRKEKPTNFEITFLNQNEEYRYKLQLDQGRVSHESLHRRTSHLFSYIFSRDLNDDQQSYSYKQKGFGFSASKAKKIRSNASLLSAAHNYDIELASSLVKYFKHYIYNINVGGRHHFDHSMLIESAEFFYKHDQLHSHMEELMCSFDLGLCSIAINEAEIQDKQGNKSKIFVPFGIHTSKDSQFELPLFEESSGTQSAFVLLRNILPVLENGGVAIIDEIDNDMHPHMLPHILELFKFKHTNPHQAQIIFTCHTPEILNLLKKHQIYLVEKQEQQSETWRLDEVAGLRADDNLYAKYMAGALSAVPNL